MLVLFNASGPKSGQKSIQNMYKKSIQKKVARNNHTVRRGGSCMANLPCIANLRPLNSNLPHLPHLIRVLAYIYDIQEYG